jgi:pimeloyl-ACP methyl ester carboxylesterase
VDDVELTVVGHSIGAFVAYELARAGTVPVRRAVFLCPFIAAPTLRARIVLRIFANRAVVLGVRCLLRSLSRRLRQRLIAAAGARTMVAEAEELLCGDDIVRYSEMAAMERRELLPRRGAGFLAATPLFTSPEQFAVFLTPRDRWVARDVPGSLRGAIHWLKGGIDHAFVVDARQSAEVAAHVHAFISRTMPMAALGG